MTFPLFTSSSMLLILYQSIQADESNNDKSWTFFKCENNCEEAALKLKSTYTPTLIGSVSTSKPAMYVKVVGNFAYVVNVCYSYGDCDSGLSIINVTNPTIPALMGSIPL